MSPPPPKMLWKYIITMQESSWGLQGDFARCVFVEGIYQSWQISGGTLESSKYGVMLSANTGR